MNRVKCPNGDFYDYDKYGDRCPHCGAELRVGGNQKADKHTFAQLFKKNKSRTGSTECESANKSSTSQRISFQALKSESVEESREPKTQNSDDKTLKLFGDEFDEAFTEAEDDKTPGLYSEEAEDTKTLSLYGEEAEDIKTLSLYSEEAEDTKTSSLYDEESDDIPKSKVASGSVSLQDVVRQASANNSGKTMGYFERISSEKKTKKQEDTGLTPRIRQNINGPVVGWLVCISGEHLGQRFEMGSGKNAIGRNEDNHIVLNRDGSVSGRKHAFIVYEPKKRDFYLQPGDSSGLTYLNDTFITEIKKLQANDMIELGGSKLLFIPFCVASFFWEEYFG